MEGKIYHICEDEKFINSAIFQFETAFFGKNFFYVVSNNMENLKHVKQEDFVYKIVNEELIELVNQIESKDLVVFHSLSSAFHDFILKLPKKVKTVWFCFGFEVYNNRKYFSESKLLAPLTKEAYAEPIKKIKFKKKIKNHLRPVLRFFNPKLSYSSDEKINLVFEKINYLGSSFEEEFYNISKLIKKKKIFFSFWYYPIELITDIEKEITQPKRNVLIGNSGYKTGNHLDVLQKIKEYTWENHTVFMPLNYGKEDYIVDIIKEGEKVLGEAFKPLRQFMPLHEYNEILETVGVAIFYNKRQQAVGNTIALLWMGAKVFLSEHNPFYSYLKRIGIIVFSFEREFNFETAKQFLSLAQIKHNRKILFQELNQKHLIDLLGQQVLKIYE